MLGRSEYYDLEIFSSYYEVFFTCCLKHSLIRTCVGSQKYQHRCFVCMHLNYIRKKFKVGSTLNIQYLG